MKSKGQEDPDAWRQIEKGSQMHREVGEIPLRHASIGYELFVLTFPYPSHKFAVR